MISAILELKGIARMYGGPFAAAIDNWIAENIQELFIEISMDKLECRDKKDAPMKSNTRSTSWPSRWCATITPAPNFGSTRIRLVLSVCFGLSFLRETSDADFFSLLFLSL